MFQEYLLGEYSEKVAKGYIKDYLDFIQYTEEKGLLSKDTTEIDIKEYILWLRDKNCTNSTVVKKISLLRKYFKWMRKNGHMIHNPMDDIQVPKTNDEKKQVTQEQKDMVWNQLKENKNIRDQVIFELLMEEGIKPNEMIGITFKDCDLERRFIYIGSSTYAEKKKIAISEKTASYILKLKDEQTDGFLLTNQHGHPLKESGIYWVINNYLVALNDTSIKPMNLMKKRRHA